MQIDATGTGQKVDITVTVAGAVVVATTSLQLSSAQTSTGTSAAGKFEIGLDDLTSGLNELTDSEASGDFRKLAYHFIKTTQGYLDDQEGIQSITVSGGVNYTPSTTIPLIFTGGGGSGATGTVTIAANGIPVSPCTISNPGTGYTSNPTVTVVDATGSSVVFAVTRTANTPDNFDVVKGFISENADGTMTRAYTVSFTFAGENLDVAPE